MTVKALVAVLPPGDEKLQIETAVMPDPEPWQVVVEQRASGVCHSQLDLIGNPARTERLVVGHESSGVVVAVGSAVDHVQPGDDVLVTWLPRSTSRERKPVPAKLPLSKGGYAVTHNVFTWSTHTVADEQYVVKAPDGTPGDVGSIIGCAVMTGAGAVTNRAVVRAGQSVAIWGVGGVGLSTVAAAHNVGASPVIAVDLDRGKLELASRLGADELVDASAGDPVAAVRELTRTRDCAEGVDFAFDCTGRPDCVRQCIAAVRRGVPGLNTGGTAVLVGAPRVPFELDGMEMLSGEKRLIGTFGGGCVPERDFPVFVDWYRDGRLDLDALVTDRYPLERVNEAVEDLRAGNIQGRAILEF
jgi:S-(hydroxymethyl)glutathione dehydrogenase / alcohol dehydrogenase